MKKLLVVLFIVCFSVSVFAQNQNYSLKGVFKNQDSAAISGLRLEFNNNGKITPAYTDINGEFSVQLASGRYELTINKSIDDKFVAFIEILENGLNPNFIEFVVDANSNFGGANRPKIVKFIKPAFPQAALAVRATGEVVVAVKIDQTGKVVSAKAESGHPLLRAASEYAARASMFEPSENSAEREAKLIFVFLAGDIEKKNVKRYSAPYRMEIIGEATRFN
jgi:hypothetical protein